MGSNVKNTNTLFSGTNTNKVITINTGQSFKMYIMQINANSDQTEVTKDAYIPWALDTYAENSVGVSVAAESNTVTITQPGAYNITIHVQFKCPVSEWPAIFTCKVIDTNASGDGMLMGNSTLIPEPLMEGGDANGYINTFQLLAPSTITTTPIALQLQFSMNSMSGNDATYYSLGISDGLFITYSPNVTAL